MNDGFINEDELRSFINGKTYDNLNNNMKRFVSFVFGSALNRSKPFIAVKIGGQEKPDLSIEHNGCKKYISIKKGSGNSVHQEKVDVFFPYFNRKTDSETLKALMMFHYGDGTIDDTGSVRYSASECKIRYRKEVQTLNAEINKEAILKEFLDRFLFIGNVGTISVDVIYHGTIDNGLWATKQEIVNYITHNNFHVNAVHFGPLTYQVWGRNENRKAVHPDRRYVMQVKWGSITEDLKRIRGV